MENINGYIVITYQRHLYSPVILEIRWRITLLYLFHKIFYSRVIFSCTYIVKQIRYKSLKQKNLYRL